MIAVLPFNIWLWIICGIVGVILAVFCVFCLGVIGGGIVHWWRHPADLEAPWCPGDPVENTHRFRAPELKEAPVMFAGWQDPCGTNHEPFELWTLTEAAAGYPKHATLSRSTLEKLGLIVRPAPYACPASFNSPKES